MVSIPSSDEVGAVRHSVQQTSTTARDPAMDLQLEVSAVSSHGALVPVSSSLIMEDTRDMDWASIDQVSALVSRTTLAGMQQLWRQHASSMDGHGRHFAEAIFSAHTQAVQDIAGVREFELKPVLSLLSRFTGSVRASVLASLQEMRAQDDAFTEQLYGISRNAFTRNLKAALEARDAWCQEKMVRMKNRYESTLATARASHAAELQQRHAQFNLQLARTLRKAGAAAAAAATAAAAAATAAAVSKSNSPMTGRLGEGSLPTTPQLGSARPQLPGSRPGTSQEVSAAAAAAAATAAASAVTAATAATASDGNPFNAEVSMLEEMFEDATAADALNQQLAADLAAAKEAVEMMSAKVDSLTFQLQECEAEVGKWKNKWAAESTKTDGVKRECQALLGLCEEHLSGLQAQHVAEISQRDAVLARAKETIINLEARLAAAGAGASLGATGTAMAAMERAAAGVMVGG